MQTRGWQTADVGHALGREHDKFSSEGEAGHKWRYDELKKEKEEEKGCR